jgi:hypothetical protein
MALRIFISFAREDIRYRDLLVGQAKNNKTPFELVDMSVQEPFDDKWKSRCREKIKHSHAFIALLSKRTWRADGARWEMKCAAEEGIPCLGIHVRKDNKGAIPPELRGRAIEWRWNSIARFISAIDRKRSLWDRFLS